MDIGFIGIGNMGKHMAQRLINAGHAVTVFDINAENFEQLQGEYSIAGSIAESCTGADIVISMLPATRHVLSAALSPKGIVESLPAGKLYLDMSTIAPSGTKKVYEAAKEKGLDFMDAPVSGGVKGAAAGSLTIFIGAEENAYQRALPVLQLLGAKLLLLGEPGAGESAKLVHNICNATLVSAFSEAIVFGEKLGLDPNRLVEVLAEGSCSKVLRTHVQNLGIRHEFSQKSFDVSYMMKDISLALETAEEQGMTLFFPALSHQLYSLLRAKGLGTNTYAEIISLFEDFANLPREKA